MVWGPLFDDIECTSSDMCKLFLEGAYPFVPPMGIPIVDVRDVSALLVAAVDTPGVGGRRLFASADTIDVLDISKHLAECFPDFASKLPLYTAPYWLIWILAQCDPQLKRILPDMETRTEMDATYVTDLTGVKFRSAREAVFAMAESLIRQKLV